MFDSWFAISVAADYERGKDGVWPHARHDVPVACGEIRVEELRCRLVVAVDGEGLEHAQESLTRAGKIRCTRDNSGESFANSAEFADYSIFGIAELTVDLLRVVDEHVEVPNASPASATNRLASRASVTSARTGTIAPLAARDAVSSSLSSRRPATTTA